MKNRVCNEVLGSMCNEKTRMIFTSAELEL